MLANTATAIQYIEYASGDVYENGMANSSVTPYWDVNTLSFDNTSQISTEAVPFWNMNNIWADNIIGLNTDTAEEFFKYGSNDMMGTRSPFLCYIDTISPSDIQLEDVCVDSTAMQQGNTIDPDNRAISVIHYTNNETLNKILNETAGGVPQGDGGPTVTGYEDYPTLGDGVFDSSKINDVLTGSPAGAPTSEVVKQKKRDIGAVQSIKNARVNVDDVPDHVQNALTKDYTGLMKAIDQKKGGGTSYRP